MEQSIPSPTLSQPTLNHDKSEKRTLVVSSLNFIAFVQFDLGGVSRFTLINTNGRVDNPEPMKFPVF